MQATAKNLGCSLLHFPADTGPLFHSSLPVVVTLHGVAQLHEPDVRSVIDARIWLERARRAIRCADAIVTDSESSRDDVTQLLGSRAGSIPIAVIPLGVDLERFYPAPDNDLAVALQKHDIKREFVLYLGNIEPRKNLISLVEAIDLINARGHGLELLVGGKTAWDYESSVAAIDASPNARRLGWITDDDVQILMSACSVFAFPSRYEGFGLPVLEAMACGAPIMCTRRGALPEVAGDVATYAEDVDADAIASALEHALKLDRNKARVAGTQRASFFSWDACAAKHHSLFREIV